MKQKEKEDSNGGTDYSPVGTCVFFAVFSSVSDKEDRGDPETSTVRTKTGKMGSKRQVCIQLPSISGGSIIMEM